jgi:hypothetical protein
MEDLTLLEERSYCFMEFKQREEDMYVLFDGAIINPCVVTMEICGASFH